MRCVGCGKDVRLKEREQSHGLCPHCTHRFATDPQSDHVTDQFLANAEQRVSGNGTYHYLQSQLVYEIRRTALRKASSRRAWGWFGLLGTLLAWVLLSHLASDLLGLALFVGLFFVVIPSVGAIRGDSRWRRVAATADDLARRYCETCRPERLITDRTPKPWREPRSAAADLGAASFERVLVCQHIDVADFFLINQFHFHHSCPVLAEGDYPPSVFADMLSRLKRNRALTVFVLHDCTPAGQDFARRVQTEERWFGRQEGVRIVDLGLFPEQRSLFARMERPLDQISPDRLLPGIEGGAELAVFRPELLIRLSAAGLVACMPFHLLPRPAAAIGDAGGGYG